MVEAMKIMGTSFNRSCARAAALSAPDPTAGYHGPSPPPETSGHSQASLGQFLVGSLLLSPGFRCTQGSFVPCKSLFPQSCVSSGGSTVGLMATSSKRAYAIPRSAAPRVPAAGHCRPIPSQDSLRHSSVSVSVGSPGVCTRFCLSPPSISGGSGV